MNFAAHVHFDTATLVVCYAVSRPNSYFVCFRRENVQEFAITRVSDNVEIPCRRNIHVTLLLMEAYHAHAD